MGIQEAKVLEVFSWECMNAEEGQSVAGAVVGTGEVAQQFIVVLGTLEDPVAHVAGVDADGRGPAAVEAGTRVAVAARLVLPARAVVHAVTANKHRHAVRPVSRAPEVRLRTKAAPRVGAVALSVARVQRFHVHEAVAVKVSYCRWARGLEDVPG